MNITEKIVESLEIVEQVNKKIEKGETDLKTFNPIEKGVKTIIDILSEEIVLKDFKKLSEKEKNDFVENLDPKEIKRLNKIATSLNKYYGEVNESRLKITRKIDDQKKAFTNNVNEKIEPLKTEREFLIEIKNLKNELEEKKEILELLPTWKEKLGYIKITKTDEELKSFSVKEFYNFLEDETEKYLAEIKREKEENERIEKAKAEAKKEAEEKAKIEKENFEKKLAEKEKEINEVKKEVEEIKETPTKKVVKIEVKENDNPLVIFLKENGVTKEMLQEKKYIVKNENENFLLYKLIAKKIK